MYCTETRTITHSSARQKSTNTEMLRSEFAICCSKSKSKFVASALWERPVSVVRTGQTFIDLLSVYPRENSESEFSRFLNTSWCRPTTEKFPYILHQQRQRNKFWFLKQKFFVSFLSVLFVALFLKAESALICFDIEIESKNKNEIFLWNLDKQKPQKKRTDCNRCHSG